MIVRSAIDAANPGGSTADYFEEYGGGEARMRHRFAELRVALGHDSTAGAEDAINLFTELNRSYATRYKKSDLPPVCRCLIECVTEAGWWTHDAPSLLGSSEEEAASIARVVSAILLSTQDAGANRPYSLVTKFLHFCFPETVAIYDSQAAASIWMWSLFAFDDDAEQAAVKPFRVNRTSDTSGSGYRGILDFYRFGWGAIPDADRSAAQAAAESLQTTLQRAAERTVVSVLDLLDKLLWGANGNPIRLGLASPPSGSDGVAEPEH